MAEAQTKRTKKSKGCVCVCVCDFRVRNGTLKLGVKGSFYSQFFVSTYFHSLFVIWLRKLTGGYLFQTLHLFIILIIYGIEILIKSDFACLYGKKFNVKKMALFCQFVYLTLFGTPLDKLYVAGYFQEFAITYMARISM